MTAKKIRTIALCMFACFAATVAPSRGWAQSTCSAGGCIGPLNRIYITNNRWVYVRMEGAFGGSAEQNKLDCDLYSNHYFVLDKTVNSNADYVMSLLFMAQATGDKIYVRSYSGSNNACYISYVVLGGY